MFFTSLHRSSCSFIPSLVRTLFTFFSTMTNIFSPVSASASFLDVLFNVFLSVFNNLCFRFLSFRLFFFDHILFYCFLGFFTLLRFCDKDRGMGQCITLICIAYSFNSLSISLPFRLLVLSWYLLLSHPFLSISSSRLSSPLIFVLISAKFFSHQLLCVSSY